MNAFFEPTDSTVLAHVMTTLNKRYNYGLDLFLLSIDEGIVGYRDDSLEVRIFFELFRPPMGFLLTLSHSFEQTVKRNQEQYEVPLKILSYEELYGWTMDRIVAQIGMKNNCTFCGVFRRQALDRGATMVAADKIVTGHNADDIAETVLMNLLRGDVPRLKRCTAIMTGSEGTLPRCKPFKYTYEKEIVMYAYFKKLDYFSTECIYSPNAYRGFAREFLKDLEKVRPSAIIDIIHAGESMCFKSDTMIKSPQLMTCLKCGYMSSNKICKACTLLEGLNQGRAKLMIGRGAEALLADSVTRLEEEMRASERVDRRDIASNPNLEF